MTAIHYMNDSATGEWLRLMADMEHEPEISIEVDPDDGMWIVGGVVKVLSIIDALELARVA
jgi:hypothetical protein